MLGSLRIADLGVILLKQNQQALVSYQKKSFNKKNFKDFTLFLFTSVFYGESFKLAIFTFQLLVY